LHQGYSFPFLLYKTGIGLSYFSLEWKISRMQAANPVNSDVYDAILIIGFGGPEHRDHVIPFLENVLRGRNVPRERMLEVAEHYYHFGGVSPINAQVRELISALRPQLIQRAITLPVYWGNRNWDPMLADTLGQMKSDGIKHALGVVLAAYSSYSSCRQYREDVIKARELTGEGAPQIDKMRVFYNHPEFIHTNALRIEAALSKIVNERRDAAHIAFTAHSIPDSMANNCRYVAQLTETCRLIAESLGVSEDRWKLVYQSRSGRPQDPWLEPDIVDHLKTLPTLGVTDVVVHPVGFLSDHMEVLYDLDDEAKHACDEIGLNMERSATVGSHPVFVSMMADLIKERIEGQSVRPAIGHFGPSHDVCPVDCCLPPPRPAAPAGASRPSA
jgi:ferrochelatase